MTGSPHEFDKDPHLSQFNMVFEFTSRGEPYSPRMIVPAPLPSAA